MDLEQMQPGVNPLDESEPAGEKLKGADATVRDAVGAVTDLVVNVAGGEDGLGAAAEVGLVEASLDPAVAGIELSVYSRVHSETLGVGVNGETVYSSYTPENTRVFEFFSNSCLPALERFAYSRARLRHQTGTA